MLACFAPPYPDETVFSLCSRFALRVEIPSRRALILEIFGQDGIYIRPNALPTHLAALVDRLPSDSMLDVNTLVDQYSALPYYLPFLGDRSVNAIRSQMEHGGKGKRIVLATNGDHHSQSALRYCPAHVIDDRRHLGETYWRRIHQLPGLRVCAEHRVYLDTVGPSRWKSARHHPFLTADEVLPSTMAPRALDMENG